MRIDILKSSMILLVLSALNAGAQESSLQKYRWTSIDAEGEATGRHENAFVAFQDKFYLIGGRGVNPVNVFDPQTNQWEARSKTPLELHHFQAVVYKDAIYIVGAMTGPYPVELPVENIWIYYPKKDEWVKGPLIPEERRRGSAGVVLRDHKIYVVCGIEYGHTSGTINNFDVYDIASDTWTSLTKAPHVRDHFPAIVVGNKLYCMGGRNTSVHHKDHFGAFFFATIPYVDVYDFESEIWHTMENEIPFPTAAGGIVQLNGCILYIGGEGSQLQAYNQTQCLDLSTGEWSQLAPLNIGRHGSSAILFEDEIYLAAGSQHRGGGNMNSIEKFSANHSWRSLFDGESLEEWEVKCIEKDKNNKFWTVNEGSILCNSMGSKDHNYIWLQNKEEFSDFELRLKFQASRIQLGNAGVQVRSRYDAHAEVEEGVIGWLDGPQVDIDPNNPWRNGFIYDETRETRRWIHPSLPDWVISESKHAPEKVNFYWEDEESAWNDISIICRGTRIITVVNNIVVSDYDGKGVLDDEAHKKYGVGTQGRIALQLHKNSQNHIRFKDIEIRPL